MDRETYIQEAFGSPEMKELIARLTKMKDKRSNITEGEIKRLAKLMAKMAKDKGIAVKDYPVTTAIVDGGKESDVYNLGMKLIANKLELKERWYGNHTHSTKVVESTTKTRAELIEEIAALNARFDALEEAFGVDKKVVAELKKFRDRTPNSRISDGEITKLARLLSKDAKKNGTTVSITKQCAEAETGSPINTLGKKLFGNKLQMK